MKEIAKNEMEKIHWDFKNHFISQTDSGLRVFSGYDPNKDFDLTGQAELQFTEDEQEESKLKLCSQIPKYLTFDYISAEKFYRQHINDTPATKEMIYEALRRAYRLKKIDVLTSNRSKKRVSANIQDDDLIKRSTQFYFQY